MMNSPNIKNLIVKYLTNEATSAELDILSKWIEKDDNNILFEAYVKINYEIRSAMNKPDVDSLKDNLLKRIKKDKNPYYLYKIPSVLKYAALIAIIFSFGYFYKSTNITSWTNQETTQDNILIPKEESITIILDNGDVQTINSEENSQIADANGNIIGKQSKTKLTYEGIDNVEKLTYNTLNIPNGKRFDLVLSDGTHVFLNSGTSIKYPVTFKEGENREVFIIGEAYFDVEKDENNPFIVHIDQMEIKVLGTKFNVSNYSEDDNINTVLVEGSVAIYNITKQSNEEKKQSTILQPGFKAEWNRQSDKIVLENVDTRVYTAWKEGKLIFRNASFKKIRKTLERHFNVSINNNNTDLDVQLFDATFDIENINEILETFNKSYAIKYDIIDNKIIIN